MQKAPEGKFMAMVKVGEKGQIVIPKGVRDMFDIKSGDTLLLAADIDRGIALLSGHHLSDFMDAILRHRECGGDEEGREK